MGYCGVFYAVSAAVVTSLFIPHPFSSSPNAKQDYRKSILLNPLDAKVTTPFCTPPVKRKIFVWKKMGKNGKKWKKNMIKI